ncbi:MAG: DUF6036 family nucleotidyltransferase [Candidatus Nanopelagicales bacterium]
MDLNREQILELLGELGQEMESRGLRAELFIVGGAAMALAFDARRATRDIDAVFVPKAEVYEAARSVAERRGLQPDWLNDAVKGFLLGEDPDRRTVFESPGCSVTVPSAQYLLAMKVYAARVDRDADDIRTLAGISGLHSADEVLDLAERYLAGIPIPAKVKFLVEELFDEGPRAPTT